MNESEDLADYVLRICRENSISTSEIERRAARQGLKITQGYISKITSRAARNISIKKLQALAIGLRRPEDEVFAVARGEQLKEKQLTDALAKAMFFKIQQLNDKHKKELSSLLRALDREIDELLDKQNK